jgi:hypothetical protein
MFKSKHSGWTWDLKRTPFGGGGGGFFSGIGDALASIDPGPSIGSALAEVDKGVGQIPGGWATLGALGAGGAGLVFAPEIAAGIEAAGLSGEAASLTPEMVAYANASADPIGTIAGISGMTPEEFAAATKVIGEAGTAKSLTAGGDLLQLMQSYPDLSQSQLENILKINYGTDSMLSSDAANLAKTGYDAGTIDQVLGYSYNPTELAGTGIQSSALNSSAGINLSDTLKAAKNGKNALDIAKLLTQGAGSGLAKSIGQLASGANPMGASQLQLVRGNQNPFTYTQQQPIQDTRQAQLASLLKQG